MSYFEKIFALVAWGTPNKKYEVTKLKLFTHFNEDTHCWIIYDGYLNYKTEKDA